MSRSIEWNTDSTEARLIEGRAALANAITTRGGGEGGGVGRRKEWGKGGGGWGGVGKGGGGSGGTNT